MQPSQYCEQHLAQLGHQERQMPFQKGQLVVHPTYGFCRIAVIERAHGRDGLEDCYVFRMGSPRNPIKVLMPVAQAEATGLRRPITRSEAEAVLQAFQLPATPLGPHSREGLDEVAARLNSRDLRTVAATVRDLAAAGVKGWDEASDGAFVNHRRSEQAMLTQALTRLIDELAHVQRVPRKEVEGQIRKCLERARRRGKAHAAAF